MRKIIKKIFKFGGIFRYQMSNCRKKFQYFEVNIKFYKLIKYYAINRHDNSQQKDIKVKVFSPK